MVGKTVLFYDALTVRTDGETTTPAGGMELPQKEFMLLFKLLSYPNQDLHAAPAEGRDPGYDQRVRRADH